MIDGPVGAPKGENKTCKMETVPLFNLLRGRSGKIKANSAAITGEMSREGGTDSNSSMFSFPRRVYAPRGDSRAYAWIESFYMAGITTSLDSFDRGSYRGARLTGTGSRAKRKGDVDDGQRVGYPRCRRLARGTAHLPMLTFRICICCQGRR